MSETTPVAPAPAVPAPNQRAGLIGCGIVFLLLGLLLFGMCALMLVSVLAAPPNPQMPAQTVAYAAVFYLLLAAVLATLGVGSFMARRWSRPLILIVSWFWLVGGLAGTVMTGFVLPAAFDQIPQSQAGARAFATGCIVVVSVLFGVLLPAAFILFYRRPAVKATLETLDPVPRWTDHIPTPLLGFASWMFVGAIAVAASTLMYRAVPFGSFLLHGWSGRAVLLAFAALMFWIAYGSVKRIPAAWWAAVVLMIVGVVWAIAFRGTDPSVWAEAMGMPSDPNQTRMMEAMYRSPFFLVWMGVVWLGYLAFLLYIRRYFSERPAVEPTVDLQ